MSQNSNTLEDFCAFAQNNSARPKHGQTCYPILKVSDQDAHIPFIPILPHSYDPNKEEFSVSKHILTLA